MRETPTLSDMEAAIRLGLKPYDEFERAMSPMLKRVHPKQRKVLLSNVYALAIKKMLNEGLKREFKNQAREYRAQRVGFARAHAHVKNALNELAAAQASFPDFHKRLGLRASIDELHKVDEFLTESEQAMAMLVHPELKTKRERSTPLPAGLRPADLTPPFPWINVKLIDRWFISAMDRCLGRPKPGRRSRFGRDKVIQKVFEILNQPLSTKRIMEIRKAERNIRRKLRVQTTWPL